MDIHKDCGGEIEYSSKKFGAKCLKCGKEAMGTIHNEDGIELSDDTGNEELNKIFKEIAKMGFSS